MVGFGETVVVCDMSEPCKFPSLDSCQKRFLWVCKEVDLPQQPAIGLVLKVGEAEMLSQALNLECLRSFFLSVSKQRSCFIVLEEARDELVS